MTSAPEVSIVVCTFNRADSLRRAVHSLLALRTGCRYEIVVVDNASTDHTPEVIRDLVALARGLVRGVHEARCGVAAARNRGLAEARGQWIAFFDDDQVADPDWLEELLAMARLTGAEYVGGSVALLLPEAEVARLSPICRGLLGEWLWIDVPTRYTRKISPGTGNLMVHRSVFDRVGTFDESLREGGEDTDLYRRIRAAGMDGWFTPKAIVHHAVPPHRLEPAYLLWVSRRAGWYLAGEERRRWGRLRFPLVAAARLGQALGLFLPRYVWAWCAHGPAERLGGRCYLARSEGYLRRALSLMAPALFSGQELASRLDFRREPRAAGAWQAEGPGCRNSPSPPAAAAVPAEPVAAASKGELGP